MKLNAQLQILQNIEAAAYPYTYRINRMNNINTNANTKVNIHTNSDISANTSSNRNYTKYI